jgi:hypothetical protein
MENVCQSPEVRELIWQQSGHTAKTLAKYSDFLVLLIVMETGGRLEKHRTEGRISIHTLDGCLLVYRFDIFR